MFFWFFFNKNNCFLLKIIGFSNRKFVFLTKNKVLRSHRILILAFLKKHNLLNISNYSSLIRESNYKIGSPDKIKHLFDDNILDKFKEEVSDILEDGVVETKYEKGNFNIVRLLE